MTLASVRLYSFFQNKTMLSSFIQQSIFGTTTPFPAIFSGYQQQNAQYKLPVSSAFIIYLKRLYFIIYHKLLETIGVTSLFEKFYNFVNLSDMIYYYTKLK